MRVIDILLTLDAFGTSVGFIMLMFLFHFWRKSKFLEKDLRSLQKVMKTQERILSKLESGEFIYKNGYLTRNT